MKKSKNINTAFSDKNLWKERLRKHVTEDSASGGRKEAISEAEDDWRLSSYYFQIYLQRYCFLNISIKEMFVERMNTLAHQLPSMGGGGAAMLKYFLLAYSGKVEKLVFGCVSIHWWPPAFNWYDHWWPWLNLVGHKVRSKVMSLLMGEWVVGRRGVGVGWLEWEGYKKREENRKESECIIYVYE